MSGVNGINNVPMEYFLNGVAAADAAPSAPPEGPGADAVPAQDAAPKRTDAKSLVAQLDVLLLQAAASSTKGVGKKTAEALKNDLRAADLLSEAEAKLLMKCQEQAQKTFKALGKFTGKQLGSAFKVVDGRMVLNASKGAGKACEAAIRAQNDLSDVLAQIGRRVGNADNAPEGLDERLIDLRQGCDRRATEMQSLAFRMNEFALHAAERGESADPNVAAILNATAAELLPRQALAMHGTADVLEGRGAAGEFAESLKPLAARIDAFAANPGAGIDDAGLAGIRADISRMKAAVESVRREGIPSGGGRMMVAKDILKAIDLLLENAGKTFERAKASVADAVRRNMLGTMERLLNLDASRKAKLEDSYPKSKELFAACGKFLGHLKTFVEASKTEPLTQKTKDLFSVAFESAKALRKTALGIPVETAKMLGDDFNRLRVRSRGAYTVLREFSELAHRIDRWSTERLLTGAEARSVFTGEISVSNAIEARVRGLRETDVDPATEPGLLVSSSKLGAGGAGEVFELQFAGGKTCVFKGETEGRGGLATLQVGKGVAYAAAQQTVQLNLASRAVADHLGVGGRIVKYSVGAHQGVFGMFMDKAKGMSVKEYRVDTSKAPPGGLSADQIRRLPPAERKRVRNEIRRQLNQLQWVDALTGQLDRHHANYFVFVDARTHEVTVQGIDNDASFSTTVEGPGKFALDTDRIASFKESLGKIALWINPRNPEAQKTALLADPGIQVREDGTLAVDVAKVQSPAVLACLKEATGAQSASLPAHIDRDMYNALVELKNDPGKRQALLDDLRDRLQPAAFDTQVKRLDAVIAHAEALAQQGCIVDSDKWEDIDEGARRTGATVKAQNTSGKKVALADRQAIEASLLLSRSFYHRDQLADIF